MTAVVDSELAPQYVSVRQAARILGISTQQVRAYIKNRTLKAYQPAGRGCHIFIDLNTLHKLPKKGTRK